jgi:hypothetical protein
VSGACEGEHLTPIPVMVNVHGLLAIA